MSKNNPAYIASLIKESLNGDSNSFAIIFCITYQDIYKKAHRVLTKEYDIQDVMFSTYTSVYNKLGELKNPNSLEKWINYIFESHLLVILRKKGMSPIENMNRLHSKKFDKGLNVMSIDNADRLLESVFMSIGKEPNSVPLETLLAYHKYKNNSLFAQRIFLVAAILLLVLVPFYMLEPKVSIVENPVDFKSNFVSFDVTVKSVLPVNTVIGTLNGNNVTVMIEGDKIYRVYATDNGTLSITTSMLNRKKSTIDVEVTEIDKENPVVSNYGLSDGALVITAEDDVSGIDYENSIVTRISDGATFHPLSVDGQSGQLSFPYFPGDTALTVYDISGKTSTYTVSSQ